MRSSTTLGERPPASARIRPEVEVVGQHDESVPTRPLEDCPVGSRAVADGAPVPGLEARAFQRLDPRRRQVHVDEELQLEPTATSCSSLRHAAYASAWRMSSRSR